MLRLRWQPDPEAWGCSGLWTRAEPPLSGKRPVSILMTVVFPLPLGPRKPKICPFSTRKLTSLTAVKLPKRLTRCSAEMAASAGFIVTFAIGSISCFKVHVGSHAGKHVVAGIIDVNFFDAYLVDTCLCGLEGA